MTEAFGDEIMERLANFFCKGLINILSFAGQEAKIKTLYRTTNYRKSNTM